MDLLEFDMSRPKSGAVENPALAALDDVLAADPTGLAVGMMVVARDLVRQITELEGLAATEVLERVRRRVL